MSAAPWLQQVRISEFTETIPRQTADTAEPGHCGALPARAFWDRYTAGCLREAEHKGPHSPEATAAARLDAAARRRIR